MRVDINAGKPKHCYGDEIYHFCCELHCDQFAAEPEYYLSGAHLEAAANAPEGTLFTCPMHPEIITEGPDSCPLCGMALEPMGLPPTNAGPNRELIDFRRRFLLGMVFGLPLLIITMGPMAGLPVKEWLGLRAPIWVELILATPVVFWCGPSTAWNEVGLNLEPEYVHAYRTGGERGLYLQRCRDYFSGDVS